MAETLIYQSSAFSTKGLVLEIRENWYSVLTLPFIAMNHMGVPRCQGQNVHDFSFENHEIQTDIFSRKVCSTLSSLTIGRLAQLKEEGGNISDQNGFRFHED